MIELRNVMILLILVNNLLLKGMHGWQVDRTHRILDISGCRMSTVGHAVGCCTAPHHHSHSPLQLYAATPP